MGPARNLGILDEKRQFCLLAGTYCSSRIACLWIWLISDSCLPEHLKFGSQFHVPSTPNPEFDQFASATLESQRFGVTVVSTISEISFNMFVCLMSCNGRKRPKQFMNLYQSHLLPAIIIADSTFEQECRKGHSNLKVEEAEFQTFTSAGFHSK